MHGIASLFTNKLKTNEERICNVRCGFDCLHRLIEHLSLYPIDDALDGVTLTAGDAVKNRSVKVVARRKGSGSSIAITTDNK
jgi:hypothetical protein